MTLQLPRYHVPRALTGAALLAAALAATAVAASGGPAAAATGQSYDLTGSAYCTAATGLAAPAANQNLISNPGAEFSTPAATLGADFPGPYPTSDLPDCWTVSSPVAFPGPVLDADPRTATGSSGARLFYGGADEETPQKSVSGVTTTGTQLIDVSSLDAGGQPFELSGNIGNCNGGDGDTAVLSATFEDAGGAALGTASLGPVGANGLLPEFWYGTVPAGTQQVLVTLNLAGHNGIGIDGSADNLDLTIGSSATPPANLSVAPFTVPYTSPGLGGGLDKPAGVSAGNGTVYVSNTDANEVAALASSTPGGVVTSSQDFSTSIVTGSLSAYGEHGDGGKASAATVFHPGGTAVDAKGDVFLADAGDNVVREITTSGTIKRIAGTPGIAGLGYAGYAPAGFPATLSSLDYPEGVAVNAAGDVYIADTYNNRVVQVTPSGQVLAVAGDGVAGYTGDGKLAAFAQLDGPAGVAVDAKGNLYIADSGNNVVRRVDAKTGIITTVAGDFAADKASGGLGGFSGDGGPATGARLDDPQGVAVDGAGDLFIADTFNSAIREVAPDGTITSLVKAGDTSATFATSLSGPYSVAADSSTRAVYVANTTSNSVIEVLGAAQPGSAAGPVAPARH